MEMFQLLKLIYAGNMRPRNMLRSAAICPSCDKSLLCYNGTIPNCPPSPLLTTTTSEIYD